MKKLLIGILSALVLAGAAFVIAGTVITRNNEASFPASGYVLNDSEDGVEQLRFDSGVKYGTQRAGKVSFKGSEGGTVDAASDSFAHLDNDSVIAFSDGVLVDFNDLSDNFINNYYIVSGLEVGKTANGYSADSSAGTINFGDHIMKLSDDDYIIRSPKLKVHLNDKDVTDVEGFVEIHVDDNGLVHIVSPDKSWTTISEDCYIETAGGVEVNPVTQIIDDGTYMMSLAKLSVDPDDCIVLTEDETLRQVVPEFDINAVDGKDGTAGGTGGAGASGAEGAAGGEGAQGTTGSAGKTGEEGKTGTAGETGGSGTGGEAGKDGVDGSAGTAGGDGKTGSTGSEGTGGTDGGGGANAEKGKDAVGESSVFKAIPQMGITDWISDSTSLKGAIAVTGESEALEVDVSSSDTFLSKVRIFNIETDEEIICYEADENYNITGRDDGKFENFALGHDIVYFTTDGDVLQPDTEYRLVVTAYYTLNGSVYAREFIARSFVTDSSGVYVEKSMASTNDLTVRVLIPDSAQDNISVTDIVFLTAEQNEKFSAPGGEIQSAYTTVYTLDYLNSVIYKNNIITGDEPDYDMNLNFDGLSSNTKYYVRNIVQTKTGTKMLAKNVLELKTLKASPTWTDKPGVSWNRATGAFQVYRPDITDPDKGITGYTYTVYDANNNVLLTRDATTETAEPMQFYLASNTSYRFGVKVKFNDNEKDIVYDVGKSDPISSSGDAMPRVTLEKDKLEFNIFQGSIRIDLSGANTTLKVDVNHPIIVKVYSDEVAYQYYGMTTGKDSSSEIEISLDDKTDVDEDRVKADLEYTVGGNEAVINLTLNNLYKSSNYALTITGYLDLNDSEGADADSLVRRSIGTVSFRTSEPPVVNCSWQANTVGDTIGQTLKLVPTDTDSTRNDYAKSQIEKGKVAISLYSGTGTNAQLMITKSITDNSMLTELVGNGLDITDTLFGQSLTGGQDYTIKVTSVSDATGKDSGLGFTNTFELTKESKPIVAGIQAPDLATDPQNQVTYTAIRNVEATKYGGIVDKDLDDDVIVGYRLQAKYDNSAYIAKSVTYYVMDYAEYYSTLVKKGEDPIGYDQDDTKTPLDPSDKGTQKLMTMTQPVYTTTEVPAVTFFFGRHKDWPLTRTTPTSDDPDEAYPPYYDINSKSYIYYGGPNIGRGFKYLFAYTAIYNTSGSEEDNKMYPYDHNYYDDDLHNYKGKYGAGIENGKRIGQGVAYILNSGLVDCPRINPRINTFLYSASSDHAYTQENEHVCDGKAIIYYTFEDLDGTLILNKSKTDNTQIVYTTPNGVDYSQAINDSDFAVSGISNWYTYTMDYVITKEQMVANPPVLSPITKIRSFISDYYSILVDLGYEPGNIDGTTSYYLCHVPIDFAYGAYIGTEADSFSGLGIGADVDLTKNTIKFTVENMSGGSDDTFLNEVCSRAYRMEMTFYEVDKDTKQRVTPTNMVGPINVELSSAWDGYYTEMSTSRLSKFVDKYFEVEARIVYDNGNMGWGLTGENNKYSMQYINLSGDESGIFQLNDYVYTSSKTLPSGMLKTQYSPVTAQTLINNVESAKTAIQLADTDDATSGTYYYYADHYGVDRSDNSVLKPELMSGRYVVPKSFEKYLLAKTTTSDCVYLKEITPAIRLQTVKNMTQLTVDHITLSSDKLSTDNTVYFRLYTNKADADSLNNNCIAEKVVKADISSGVIPNQVFTDLAPETDYYMTVSMLNAGVQSFLLKQGTNSNAIYPFTTKSGVTITSTQTAFTYYNDSYFSKNAAYNFTVSEYINYHAKYDIYATEQAAEDKAADKLILSDEDMRESGILTAPDTLLAYNSDIDISLEPSKTREKLKPNRTYYVRVTILDPDLTTEAGHKVVPLTIGTATGTRGLIYTENATGESISFQLTLNDYNYTVMGRKSGGVETGPFYAVRFTDSNGNLLKTVYDDSVYSFADQMPTFTLDETTLKLWNQMESQRIIPSTSEKQNIYQMHVYCVIDKEHSGNSYPVDGSGTTHDWQWFFNGSGDRGFAENFLGLLDSFWNSDFSKTTDSTLLSVEENFKLVSGSQTSTSEDGYYVNFDGMYPERATESSVKIVFKDSYGLILNDVDQFRKIKWTVKGRDVQGTIINEQGESTCEDNPNDMIKYEYDQVLKYWVYKFQIPTTLIRGNYQISIQLYNTDGEGQLAPYGKTVTMEGTY